MIKRLTPAVFLFAMAVCHGPVRGQSAGNADYEVARLKATLQQVLQDHERIVGMLEQNRQVTEAIVKRLQAVEGVAARGANAVPADAATKGDIQALRAEIAAERRAREQAIEAVISSMSREISRAAASAAGPGGGRGAGAGGASANVPSQGVYTVVGGDTLSTIAQAFGVSVAALKNANGLNDDIIRVGQKLTIPAK